MRNLARMLGTGAFVALMATAAAAEQRWQCGDGLTVPLSGTRAEREIACKQARQRRDHPPSTLERQHKAELERRVEKLEKEYGVDIDAETH